MVLQKILVISRQTEFLQLGRRFAVEVTLADDVFEAIDIASTVKPNAILVDANLPVDKIGELLCKTDNNLRIPVIIIGNGGDKPAWLSQPFHYYLPNINDNDRLQQILNSIQAQMDPNHSADSNGFFADDLAASVAMGGKSRAILETLKMIKLVASSNCNPVLIVGETGTGKELAAKAVHRMRHFSEQFVAVNCAALTANLLESELFGHVKGSFTSADKEKTGLLELADQGTIFLDEISEMPLDLQAKLLRVLQEKTFRKVGGIVDLTCKATIIASSNRNLILEVQAGRFRRDLFYRLNICPITISPLSAASRKDDIRLLAKYFLQTSTICPAKAGKITSFTEMALEVIEKHSWPGNVRELRNVIERAIMLETTDKIGLSSIVIEAFDVTQAPNFMFGGNHQDKTGGPPVSAVSNFSLEKAERAIIARALQESGWQKTRAAALLGITRATLYAKVKQHNIQRGAYIPKAEQDNTSCLAIPELADAIG